MFSSQIRKCSKWNRLKPDIGTGKQWDHFKNEAQIILNFVACPLSSKNYMKLIV